MSIARRPLLTGLLASTAINRAMNLQPDLSDENWRPDTLGVGPWIRGTWGKCLVHYENHADQAFNSAQLAMELERLSSAFPTADVSVFNPWTKQAFLYDGETGIGQMI